MLKWLQIVMVLGHCGLWACQAYAASRLPNIILIQTDDQGYDDVGFHGNQLIDTPNMDGLAREGVSFSQFYANETCAPTRAALLSGRHFLSAGVWGVHGGRDYLNKDEATFAEIFRYHGYRTAIFGKWHTGKTAGYLPWDRGFDEAWMNELYQYVNNTMLHQGRPVVTQGWAAEVATDLALKFIDDNRTRPFFVYLPYMEPHEGNGPDDSAYTWHAPQRFIDPYLRKGLSKPMAKLYAMISHVDFQMGRVLQKLEQLGLKQDTIVIYMSDNGPIGSSAYPSDSDWQLRNFSGLRANKGTIYENGIRIPFVVRWPGHIQPGRTDQLGTVADVLPTLLDLTQLALPATDRPLNGVSLSSVLTSPQQPAAERSLFFSTRAPDSVSSPNDKEFFLLPDQGKDRRLLQLESSRTAIRKGDYKLVNLAGTFELFDIKHDPQERMALDRPELKAQLKNELQLWWNQIVASPEAFAMPVFQIGPPSNNWSRVYANGAVEKKGGVRIFTLDTQGWQQVGDSITMQVDVKRAGLYQITLQASPRVEGAEVRLQIGEREVRGDPWALPPLALPMGPAQLTLQVSQAPRGVFEKLEAIDFSLQREDQRYPACVEFGGGYGEPFACSSGWCRKSNQDWVRNGREDFWCQVAERK